jgi:hypothetical protein
LHSASRLAVIAVDDTYIFVMSPAKNRIYVVARRTGQ